MFRANFFLDIIVNTFHNFIGIMAKTSLFRFKSGRFVAETSVTATIVRATDFTDIAIRIDEASFWTG